MESSSLFFRRLLRWALCVFVLGIGAGPPLFADDDPVRKRGERLYTLCSACHGADARGNQKFKAPALAGLADWYLADQINKFRDGRRGAHHEDTAGLLMRPMSRALRTDEDVTAVAAFLASLEPEVPEPTLTGGDPKAGEALYAICAACHGQHVEGNTTLKSPSLRYLPDWYQLEQLKKYKAGIRGASDPNDTQSVQMMAITAGLPPAEGKTIEETMVDIIAYISEMAKKPVPPAPATPPSDAATAEDEESAPDDAAPSPSSAEENKN